FDTPPCLVVADSPVLAASIEANVVMVVEAGKTRRSAALKAREQFASLNVNVQGVVLNGVRRRDISDGYEYGGYYYYYGYTSRDEDRDRRRNSTQINQPANTRRER
ncbi:MAG: hypothetical protein JW910_02550, partial [Anaerolineae bacterium]|nr:hypothetical protein [Anaerolineae bacterium]